MTAMLLLVSTALATAYNVDFCITVDISYTDADAGNRWEDDTADKPARGFYYEVIKVNAPSSLVASGFTTLSGTNAGCTGNISLDSANTYKVDVESRSYFSTTATTVYAVDDTVTQDTVTDTAINNFTPNASTQVFPAPLDGATEDRWNHLALVNFALVMHDLDLTNVDVTLVEDTCCSAGETYTHLAGTKKKFIVAHELGHTLSGLRDAGGNGCNDLYNAADDGCVGDSSSPGLHGQLTKEYQSASACEGIADFYAAVTWNTSGASDACEYQRQYSLDWDIDGTTDVSSSLPHACLGDPFADNPDLVTGVDWLDDAVTNGFGSCTGTLTNRSTQFAWLRYGWDMVTVQGVPLGHFWQIWDDADPWDWNDDDSGAVADRPHRRMQDAADAYPPGCTLGTTCYDTEHDNAKIHGLNH